VTGDSSKFGEQLVRVRAAELSADTAQTSGMKRFAAIAEHTVGARAIFMGRTDLPAGVHSGPHHHGESETGIYVVAGHPAFVFRQGDELVRLETSPGDYVYVPPHVPHVEENPGGEDAVVVIARSTQEAIVVNLDAL
jgi:uncharacterized RmlC-like cupin family protein